MLSSKRMPSIIKMLDKTLRCVWQTNLVCRDFLKVVRGSNETLLFQNAIFMGMAKISETDTFGKLLVGALVSHLSDVSIE